MEIVEDALNNDSPTSVVAEKPASISPNQTELKAGPAAVSSSNEEGDVASPISGVVLNVDVNVGDQVTRGDEIITIEAMKMNTFVSASSSGKISQILVNPGDSVTEGQLLAKIQ